MNSRIRDKDEISNILYRKVNTYYLLQYTQGKNNLYFNTECIIK